MDFAKILAQLRLERDMIQQAIESMEKLAAATHRGRGRPPGSTTDPAKKRGRPKGSRKQVPAASATGTQAY